MKRTPEQINQIVDAMWDALDNADINSHVGVRADDASIKKQFRASWNRPDNIRTTRLPGVSVVYVGYDNIQKETLRSAIISAQKYGATLYLLEGESPTDLQYCANDPSERIFTSHKILWREEEK